MLKYAQYNVMAITFCTDFNTQYINLDIDLLYTTERFIYLNLFFVGSGSSDKWSSATWDGGFNPIW